MRRIFRFFIFTIALLCCAACGTKKAVVKGTPDAGEVIEQVQKATAEGNAQSQMPFMQMVNDRKVDTQNIVADITFSASSGNKDISAPGCLRMRRDKVIRLQIFIPILGTEVGRLEFTPDYVLVVDRLHKEYVKGDYNQLDFLRDNGLNFHSLQALFWNELFLPGSTGVNDNDLSKFKADINDGGATISLQNGLMGFLWKVSARDGQINEADVTYSSPSKGSSVLTWNYSDFKAIGDKMFPATQVFSFTSQQVKNGRKTTVQIEMDGLKTNAKWEAETTLSSKYKQVDAKDVLGKLLSK